MSEREHEYDLQLVRTVVQYVMAAMYECTKVQLLASLRYIYTEDTNIDRHIYEQLPWILHIPYQWPIMSGNMMLLKRIPIIRWRRLYCLAPPIRWVTEVCVCTGHDRRS